MPSLRYRLLKAGDTCAYLALLWLTWRWIDDELHWRLAIGAIVLGAGWLTLTAARMNRLFTTYFDVLSRLEVVVPMALGVGLGAFALVHGHHWSVRTVAALEIAGWALLFLRYRRNRAHFVRQGHGPLPAGCWVSPPVELLEPGDLILTSGMVAAGLRETVGHGETVLGRRDGALVSFTSRMDRGAYLHAVAELTDGLRASGHYIVLRLHQGLAPADVERAQAIALEMIERNRRWAEATNRRREAFLARVPLPAAAKQRLRRALHTSGYDWLGLFMGRLTDDRWTCIGACLELYRQLGVRTAPYGTGLLGFGTTLFDPIMPVRFLSDPAFRLLTRTAATADEPRA
jgi:hypothetical protein